MERNWRYLEEKRNGEGRESERDKKKKEKLPQQRNCLCKQKNSLKKSTNLPHCEMR